MTVTKQIDRRFIEDSFPIRAVSIESAREKAIRQGHIATLHIWWARRPLVASRAINYAALIPAPKDDERDNVTKFITEMARWQNSNNSNILERAKKDIIKANNDVPPKVLDPFSGGGSIPLEALRLGSETYANDYNPVATLMLKCAVEYPQKYSEKTYKSPSLVNEGKGNSLRYDVNRCCLLYTSDAADE